MLIHARINHIVAPFLLCHGIRHARLRKGPPSVASPDATMTSLSGAENQGLLVRPLSFLEQLNLRLYGLQPSAFAAIRAAIDSIKLYFLLINQLVMYPFQVRLCTILQSSIIQC